MSVRPAVGGKRAVAEAIRAGRALEVLIAPNLRATQGMRSLTDAAVQRSIPVRDADRRELDRLDAHHQGVVAVLVEEDVPSALGERDLALRSYAVDAIVVMLDGVTDPQNLGAAARSAEAAGVELLVTRIHRAADVTPSAIRASAGAMMHLPLARVANIARAIGRLQEAGFTVIGLDAEASASIYAEPCPEGRVAIVIGSEGAGLSRLVRERCDQLRSLPMHGQVGSLNASASLAAALYGYVLPSR